MGGKVSQAAQGGKGCQDDRGGQIGEDHKSGVGDQAGCPGWQRWQNVPEMGGWGRLQNNVIWVAKVAKKAMGQKWPGWHFQFANEQCNID